MTISLIKARVKYSLDDSKQSLTSKQMKKRLDRLFNIVQNQNK